MIRNFFSNLPIVIKNLLIINALMFLAKIMLFNQGVYLDEYLSIYNFKSPLFQPYQIVTSMFMHADIAHLFFNMFGLIIFGSVLERIWGTKRFFIFYMACGIGANILSGIVNYFDYASIMENISGPEIDKVMHIINERLYLQPSGILVTTAENDLINHYLYAALGASGAIFGIFVAFGVLFPNTELMLLFFPVPIKAKYFIPIMVLIELSFGMAQVEGDNIAHFVHLSGGLIGFILVKLWQRDRKNFY